MTLDVAALRKAHPLGPPSDTAAHYRACLGDPTCALHAALDEVEALRARVAKLHEALAGLRCASNCWCYFADPFEGDPHGGACLRARAALKEE